MMDFFQILYGEFRIRGVKHHIIPFHCLDGSLLKNLCAVLTIVIVPITVDIAYPVQHIRRKYLSVSCERCTCHRGDFLQQGFYLLLYLMSYFGSM